MDKKDRIKKIINWLVFNGVVEGQNDLAVKLGYSKSYMSQVCNEAKVISDSFIDKLCSLDENLSTEWAISGVGDMFKSNPFGLSDPSPVSEPKEVVVDASVWEVIKNQAASLASRDKQVDELISMLREEIAENKKIAARLEGHAECADVG